MSEEGKKRNKKISRMTLQEIEAKIQDVRSQMGGDGARYMKHLYQRKQVLVAK